MRNRRIVLPPLTFCLWAVQASSGFQKPRATPIARPPCSDEAWHGHPRGLRDTDVEDDGNFPSMARRRRRSVYRDAASEGVAQSGRAGVWVLQVVGLNPAVPTSSPQSIRPPEKRRPGTDRKYPTAWPPSAPTTLPVV